MLHACLRTCIHVLCTVICSIRTTTTHYNRTEHAKRSITNRTTNCAQMCAPFTRADEHASRSHTRANANAAAAAACMTTTNTCRHHHHHHQHQRCVFHESKVVYDSLECVCLLSERHRARVLSSCERWRGAVCVQWMRFAFAVGAVDYQCCRHSHSRCRCRRRRQPRPLLASTTTRAVFERVEMCGGDCACGICIKCAFESRYASRVHIHLNIPHSYTSSTSMLYMHMHYARISDSVVWRCALLLRNGTSIARTVVGVR